MKWEVFSYREEYREESGARLRAAKKGNRQECDEQQTSAEFCACRVEADGEDTRLPLFLY